MTDTLKPINTTKRKMPTELAIRAHWAERLWRAKGYDSKAEFMERGTCFACGLDGNERAHIVARVVGGSDEPENLNILCGVCHKDSEYLDGGRYIGWLMQRSPVDRLMSEAMRFGFNPAALMQPHTATRRAIVRAAAALTRMESKEE